MAAQGTGPITDISQLRGDFWPEDEAVEDFLQALYEWRGRTRRDPAEDHRPKHASFAGAVDRDHEATEAGGGDQGQRHTSRRRVAPAPDIRFLADATFDEADRIERLLASDKVRRDLGKD